MGAITEAEFEAQKAKLIGSHQRVEALRTHTTASTVAEAHETEHEQPANTIEPVQSESPLDDGSSCLNEATTDQRTVSAAATIDTVQPSLDEQAVSGGLDKKISLIDRLPSWSSIPDIGKMAVIAVGLAALWLLWLALKYLGIILGITLLIYSVREMRSAKEAMLELEGNTRKKAEIRADNFKFLTGAAVALIVVSAVVDYFAFPIRKNETEIAESQYKSLCSGDGKFDAACKGKFIIWDGIVQSVGSDYIRTKIGDDGPSVDIKDIDPSSEAVIEGQKVRVSGWLAQENFFHPDVSKGRVEPLETVDVAKVRVKAQEAAELAHAKEQKCAKIMPSYIYMSVITAQCRSKRDFSNPIALTDIDFMTCVSLRQDEARECGFNGPWQ